MVEARLDLSRACGCKVWARFGSRLLDFFRLRLGWRPPVLNELDSLRRPSKASRASVELDLSRAGRCKVCVRSGSRPSVRLG